MKMKIHKGDRVLVMRGDEDNKDKVGEVIRVLPKENRVVVQGVNMVKKHQKQTQSGGKTIPAGIREFEAPIHASNVVVVDREAEKEAKGARKATKAKADSAKKPAAKKPAEKKAESKPAAKKPAAKATESKAKPAESKKKAAKGN
ncbi:MAG TPA: 50S ribosomal protein L24 [Anaerolineaceae bacterium]|jgi:large subunit ribosomal protein L24|nr:50S ribosomal protein L24 [Anaerolineaceae bacterium]